MANLTADTIDPLGALEPLLARLLAYVAACGSTLLPDSCPQVVKEDANVAITDGDRLSTGDELDGMCGYLQSQ